MDGWIDGWIDGWVDRGVEGGAHVRNRTHVTGTAKSNATVSPDMLPRSHVKHAAQRVEIAVAANSQHMGNVL
jgi:hypothetical protein